MIDHQKIESLSVGLLSPSHLQRRQWCQVDGWCDGERLTLHVRKTHGRFSMHLCPRKIRKVAVKKAVRVLRKVSLKQKLCSWLLLSPVRQYKWRWERAWESSITLPRAECESACQRRLLTSKDKREKTAYVRSVPWSGSIPLPGFATSWQYKKTCYNTKYSRIR